MSSTRLQSLFDAAVELAPADRAAFLDRECADDPALREQLRSLLAVDQRLQHTTLAPVTPTPLLWAGALSAGVRPGQQLGAFRVCEPLGQGGMGVVFRGERHDGPVQQQVAIKIVRREYLEADVLRRFELERQTLATLHHPYIARLLDADKLDDGTPYFVMEYVDGLPITEYCARQGLDLRSRITLMRHVCQAVAHAHRHLIVHRDLKPGNILVGTDALPKLLDFGIAKRLGSLAPDQTGTGRQFFSPGYSAPEQFRGEPVHVGCDIYALGVLLYELLTGVRPFDFDGMSLGQIESMLESMPAPAPSSRLTGAARRALRGDLDDIVLRCLRKAPAERYGSVEQLEADLGHYLNGQPVSVRGGHAWYRLRKFVARHRWAVSIAGLSAAALAGAALLLWQQNLALRSERDLSRQALDLMKDAFAAADPIRTSGADISARQILDSAQRRLDGVVDQPALYATLAHTIGEVNLSLGQTETATTLLERAVAAAATADWESAAQSQLQTRYARALINADQLDRAQAALDAAHQLNPVNSADWSLQQARVWSRRGEHVLAVARLRELAKEIAARPPTDEFATGVRLSLADALTSAGQTQDTLEVLDATLAWQRQLLPATHPQVLRTRMRKVSALRAAERLEDARTGAAEVVEAVVRVFGADSAEASYGYNNLARTLEALNRTDEALDAYRKALSAAQRSHGRDHANTRRIEFNLAYTLDHLGGHAEEAEAHYREALLQSELRGGPQSAMAVYVRIHYARFLNSQTRSLEALRLLTPADGWLGIDGADPENRADYLTTLRELTDRWCIADAADTPHCKRAQMWLQRSPSP